MSFAFELFKLLLVFNIQQFAFGKNVIIIGSGPSGIAAATRLLEANLTDILVLEAEDRIGGRIYTKPLGEHVIEIGAQWCRGHNMIYKLANPLGYLEDTNLWSTQNFSKQSRMSILGQVLNNETTYDLATFLYGGSMEDDDNMTDPRESVGDFYTKLISQKMAQHDKLKSISKEVRQSLIRWYERFLLTGDASESWYEIPVEGGNDYHSCDGPSLSWKKGGFKSILEILMKKLPDKNKQLPIDEKILLNKEVTNIKWDNSNNELTVECQDGSKYKSDLVLLTMSVAVLQHDMKKLFTPELPSLKQNAIQGLSLGATAKLFLQFEEPWWSDIIFLHFLWTDETKEQFKKEFSESDDWILDIPMFHSIAYQPKVLLGWVVGKHVAKMESLDENHVKTQLMKLIRLFYGSIYKISEPKAFFRSTWRTNPHFRGTYSYHGYNLYKYNTSSHDLSAPVLNSNGKQVLYFAGEATSEHYFGTVHGAIEAGWREADRILGRA